MSLEYELALERLARLRAEAEESGRIARLGVLPSRWRLRRWRGWSGRRWPWPRVAWLDHASLGPTTTGPTSTRAGTRHEAPAGLDAC
jgi:hypothetical protein